MSRLGEKLGVLGTLLMAAAAAFLGVLCALMVPLYYGALFGALFAGAWVAFTFVTRLFGVDV